MARLFDDIALAAALERVDQSAETAAILGTLSTNHRVGALIASAHIDTTPPWVSVNGFEGIPSFEPSDEQGTMDGGEVPHGSVELPASYAPRLVAPTVLSVAVAAAQFRPLPVWMLDGPLYSVLDFFGVSLIFDKDGALRLIPDIDLRP